MKKTLFALVPLVALALTAALGFFAGRRVTIGEIETQLATDPSNTLSRGVSLAEAPLFEREAASACFLDGPKAAARFAEISWAPPAVPIPFVGFGPRPGRHLSCFVTPLLLRAERDPVLPKPPGVTRIVLVGGSVAFGSGAPFQDRTVGAYLERELAGALGDARVEVFTLAYPWWTSTHERILIENRVPALEPDLVLVLSGYNDVREAIQGNDVRWMRTPVDRSFFERVSGDYALAGFPPLVDVVAKGAAPPPDVVAERLHANARLEERALAGKLRFVLQPCLFAGAKPLTAREQAIVAKNGAETRAYFERSYAEIRSALAPGGFFADAQDAFADTKEDVFLDTAHVADRGNLLLARRIAALLRSGR